MTTAEVIHGDCAVELGRLPNRADLILTSPPYDDLREYGGHAFDFESVADACVHALKPGGVLVWIVADRSTEGSYSGTSHRQVLGFMDRGLKLRENIVYHKERPKVRGRNQYHDAWEGMYVFTNGFPNVVNLLTDRPNKDAGRVRKDLWGAGRTGNRKAGKRPGTMVVSDYGIRTNLWSYATGFGLSDGGFKRAYEHPAIFPYKLAVDHVLSWTNPGDMVVDPMCGSGTAVSAAKNLGRDAIGIEIHEEYVKIARERIAQEVLEWGHD